MLENGEVESVTYSGNRLVITPKADSKNYSRFTQYYTVMIPDAIIWRTGCRTAALRSIGKKIPDPAS